MFNSSSSWRCIPLRDRDYWTTGTAAECGDHFRRPNFPACAARCRRRGGGGRCFGAQHSARAPQAPGLLARPLAVRRVVVVRRLFRRTEHVWQQRAARRKKPREAAASASLMVCRVWASVSLPPSDGLSFSLLLGAPPAGRAARDRDDRDREIPQRSLDLRGSTRARLLLLVVVAAREAGRRCRGGAHRFRQVSDCPSIGFVSTASAQRASLPRHHTRRQLVAYPQPWRHDPIESLVSVGHGVRRLTCPVVFGHSTSLMSSPIRACLPPVCICRTLSKNPGLALRLSMVRSAHSALIAAVWRSSRCS